MEHIDTPIFSQSEAETQSAGIMLGESLHAPAVIAISGAIGVGKTVFTRGIAQGCHIHAAITSPTFEIIHEFENRFFHIDLYRLTHVHEVELLDIWDYLGESNIVVIEWPELAAALVPPHTIAVSIALYENDMRKIEIKTGN